MTWSVYNYDLGSNIKKNSLNLALIIQVNCSMQFVYHLSHF